jgi:aryl-alcohol dehydrogenase-like predicted oxidoreductase
MKLALGTAQFGMDYGIASRSGRVPQDEIGAILTRAKSEGIDTLDTAIAYGESEVALGKCPLAGWRIITKLGPFPEDRPDTGAWVTEQIQGSLQRLGVSSLYGVLLHSPRQLLQDCGGEILSALEAAKREGVIRKSGISIYDPSELDGLWDHCRPDIVQAPFNILDRRLVDSGWLRRMQESDTEVHVRSIFLQGLLLMGREDRPLPFQRWDRLWASWHGWLQNSDLTPLEACVRHALSFTQISRVVVGVDSLRHLEEICKAVHGDAPKIPASLQTDDIDLLNPSRWSRL